MPLKQLAEQVFLSSPATAARIERLEKEGIISEYTIRLNLKKIGFPILAFINLEIAPTQKSEFYPFICSHPNVLECNCITGQYSMLIKVTFETTEQLDAFIDELQRFGATQTHISFSTPQESRGVGVEKIFSNEN